LKSPDGLRLNTELLHLEVKNAELILQPILRLLNLQLQRQRCSKR
jgi:hypothetical protein